MGAYDSHFSGEIRITPPLTWAQIRSAPYPALRDVALGIDERAEDTPTGQIRTIVAPGITPIRRSAYNGSDIEAEIQAVIDAYPDHEFTGTITAEPEDPGGTPWRYVIQGRQVVRQEARLVWPDDSEATT